MEILIILTWLQIKHWIVDFVIQSTDQIARKGIYGDRVGISHSLEHGIGTLAALFVASFYVNGLYVGWIIIAAIFDSVIHYHIDYIKIKYGTRDMAKPIFWNQFGLDQMAHQLTYLFLIYILY